MTNIEILRQECGGLDRLMRASLVSLLLARDEAAAAGNAVLLERIEWAIAGYGA